MGDWILVVDDNVSNLKMASHILTEAGMRVSCLKSGEETLKFLNQNKPDIILLDIRMPGMDGFDTMALIQQDAELSKIPIIFLTADEDSKTETRGIESGAVDFIRKPFVPQVFLTRIRHAIELQHLQSMLSCEVEKKTKEAVRQQKKTERLFVQVINALMGAVDAKDPYTNGHSARVAEYSKKIAQRLGMSVEEQNDIYTMGLLHDVGKIGISDAILNKPSGLTDEEYEEIKKHPLLGAGILENITEFPLLAIGAKWHHEHYNGEGYPDGLSGNGIPIEARIIAVADTYDAMTSKRSYRDVLPQEEVRREIKKRKGTQFDPELADIMLQLIDEDTGYTMKEQ